jgi:uroporphyrinogen-III synthase
LIGRVGVRVIVTRPAAQAADWAQQLQARGIDAFALPLIGIAPADDPAALQAAWVELDRHRLVVFVSPNAAEQFFARRPAAARWPESVLAGSPGPGTTRVLTGLGVPVLQVVEPAADASQFDSESLWAQLGKRDWHGASVLIVRGDGGRDWLAETLRRHGAQVSHVAAYRRVAPGLDARQRALLREAIDRPGEHLWFFSSSEAIDNLAVAAPASTDWSRAQALATHPRIATRARQLGLARVIEARPALDAVVACIQSIGP